MRKHRIISKIKKLLLIVICLQFALALIKHPSLSAEGVKKGLALCAGTMIPSLFPFLVLSNFAVNCGIVGIIGEKLNGFFKKVFNLSGTAGSVVFISLVSGFPVGCSMASSLYENKKITKTEFQRIAISCVNAGPAFVIGAVGTMLLSSPKAGLIIFASLSVSSVLTAFLTRFVFEDEETFPSQKAFLQPTSDSLISAVYSSSKAMLSICAWIVVFSCAVNLVTTKIQTEEYLAYIKAILEVSSGCEAMSKTKSPVILSAVIAWSGLSVHCQIFPYVKKSGLTFKHLFCSRLTNAMLSSLICTLLVKIFPCEVSVFSNMTEVSAKIFNVSAPAAVGLILMCAIFILDLDRLKKV